MTVNTDLAVFTVFTRCRNRIRFQVFIEFYINGRITDAVLINKGFNVLAAVFRIGFSTFALNLNSRTELVRLYAARVGIEFEPLFRQAVCRILQVRYVDRCILRLRIACRRIEFIEVRRRRYARSRMVGNSAAHVIDDHSAARRSSARILKGSNNVGIIHFRAARRRRVEFTVVVEVYLVAVLIRINYGARRADRICLLSRRRIGGRRNRYVITGFNNSTEACNRLFTVIGNIG